MGSDRSDIDAIREALDTGDGPDVSDWRKAHSALDRVAASLAEKDAQMLAARSAIDWCIGYFSDPGFTPTKPYFDRGAERLREARAALGVTDEGEDRG